MSTPGENRLGMAARFPRSEPLSDAPNPFAAPQAEVSDWVETPLELHGRMPTSVILAVSCLGVLVALNAFAFAAVALGSGGGNDLFIGALLVGTPLAIGLLVLFGLLRKKPLARQWGRIMGLLLGVLATLFLAAGSVGFFYFFYSGDFGQANAGPSGDQFFLLIGLIGLLVYALPAGLLWAIFFALGYPGAKQWFGLVCPECHSRRTKAANFWYSRVRCKDCGAQWRR